MSNYQAVATVTAILQRMLQVAVQEDVDGVRVTTVQPRQIGTGTPETGVNLFLYQVTRNAALNNADATPFRSKGTPVKRQVAFDLHYIISFYGNDVELEPQRLLGSIARMFNDRPYVPPELIQETLADPTFRFLANSNLADQIQQLLIVPIDLPLEDLSKLWSGFFQAPYLLSLVYKVTTVLIDGEESLRRALPVRDRSAAGIAPFPSQPMVEQVASAAGKLEPILIGSALLIRGQQLQGQETLVRIGDVELVPTEVSASQITVMLPAHALKAGMQGLQVLHQIQSDPRRIVESNIAPFVLRPAIVQVHLTDQMGYGDELRSATLMIQVDVNVGVKQRAVLAVNEWSTEEPVAYQFEAEPRSYETNTIAVRVSCVKAGEYLLRLQIDGAETLLNVDTDPNSPTFNWYNSPKVHIH